MKSKWRNYGLWVSLTAALLLGVQTVGVIFGVEFTSDKYDQVAVAVNAVLGVLVVLGIVSNPEAGKGYTDKE
ncbi:phage holin [Paenibacillus sp. FSL R10-2199]|uniref:phage holin n=1 Tax=Paenibacillus sp. FSL R10-2199 TaxID=2975348 RepID=UPI0030FAE6D3